MSLLHAVRHLPGARSLRFLVAGGHYQLRQWAKACALYQRVAKSRTRDLLTREAVRALRICRRRLRVK